VKRAEQSPAHFGFQREREQVLAHYERPNFLDQTEKTEKG